MTEDPGDLPCQRLCLPPAAGESRRLRAKEKRRVSHGAFSFENGSVRLLSGDLAYVGAFGILYLNLYAINQLQRIV